jgi:hypothetical protein
MNNVKKMRMLPEEKDVMLLPYLRLQPGWFSRQNEPLLLYCNRFTLSFVSHWYVFKKDGAVWRLQKVALVLV